MRKISTKERAKKKQQRKQLIVGLVLVFIMLMSVVGYSLQSGISEENSQVRKVNYNGVYFYEQNGYWIGEINGIQIVLANNPLELEEVNWNLSPPDYSNEPLYIVSQNEEIVSRVYYNFEGIVERVQRACLEKCEEDYPIKTCQDNVIIIEESENEEVKQQGNCIFVYATSKNIDDKTDKLFLDIFGLE